MKPLTEKDLFSMEGQTVMVMTFGLDDQICMVKIDEDQVHCENDDYDFYYINGDQPEGLFFVYGYDK